MIQLYTHPFSIVPWRVSIALHEKGLSYEEVRTDLYSGDPPAGFLDLNPFAQIPVLQHGDLVIAESMAILEYLEEQFPKPPLMPTGVTERAKARMFMGWCTDYWPPAWKLWMAPRLPPHLADPWTDASVQEGRTRIAHHLDVLEARLQNQDWLLGSYSLADICYAPFVLVLPRVELGGEIEARPAVSAWHKRLNKRPAIQATMMPPSPE